MDDIMRDDPQISRKILSPASTSLYSDFVRKTRTQSCSSLWFQASETLGDFMGISYGRLPKGSEEMEWHFVSHCECDGIGGLARLLRERGAQLRELPQTTHRSTGIIAPLWWLWRASNRSQQCANRLDWERSDSLPTGDRGVVAWHLFTEKKTEQMLARCRREKLTMNSLLLKFLDQAIRPEIQRPELKIPWMIPVNLRGGIQHADDTENHVSCVEVFIAPGESAGEIQKQIHQRLARGEQWGTYQLLELGRFLSQKSRVKLLEKDRQKPAGNIGAFSNLGVWDKAKEIETGDSWIFCPPTVKGQLLAAGCVTFQNRLSLAIQAAPTLSATPDIADGWMQRWLEGLNT
jgi:hypothetical protein